MVVGKLVGIYVIAEIVATFEGTRVCDNGLEGMQPSRAIIAATNRYAKIFFVFILEPCIIAQCAFNVPIRTF